MKHWTRDKIQSEIDKNTVLKAKLDQLQVQERANNLDIWAVQLRNMIEVNCRAIGCKHLLDLEEQLGEVMDYINQHANGRLGWKKIVNMTIHRRAIASLAKNRAARRVCHIVNGRDYVCYCDEKEAV